MGYRCPNHPQITYSASHPTLCNQRIRKTGTHCQKCGEVNPRIQYGMPNTHAGGCNGVIVDDWELCGTPLEEC